MGGWLGEVGVWEKGELMVTNVSREPMSYFFSDPSRQSVLSEGF